MTSIFGGRELTGTHMQVTLQVQMGQRVRRFRIERGLSQDDLARQIGRSQAYISDLELGHTLAPALEMLKAVARALGIPVGSLLPPDEWPPFEDYLRDRVRLPAGQISFVQQLVEALQAEHSA
jgi:transcriptional regulator with XRE-family HTH domain